MTGQVRPVRRRTSARRRTKALPGTVVAMMRCCLLLVRVSASSVFLSGKKAGNKPVGLNPQSPVRSHHRRPRSRMPCTGWVYKEKGEPRYPMRGGVSIICRAALFRIAGGGACGSLRRRRPATAGTAPSHHTHTRPSRLAHTILIAHTTFTPHDQQCRSISSGAFGTNRSSSAPLRV